MGRDRPKGAVDVGPAAFSVQPEAVFRLEAISASLFRSKNWSQRSCVSFGDDLFPMEP